RGCCGTTRWCSWGRWRWSRWNGCCASASTCCSPHLRLLLLQHEELVVHDRLKLDLFVAGAGADGHPARQEVLRPARVLDLGGGGGHVQGGLDEESVVGLPRVAVVVGDLERLGDPPRDPGAEGRVVGEALVLHLTRVLGGDDVLDRLGPPRHEL